MSRVVSRRTFLSAVAASAIITADRTLSLSIIHTAVGDPRLQLEAQLYALFSNADSARAIGAEYLRQYPAEAAAATLTELTGLASSGHSGAPDQHLPAVLRERITADFEVDAIVQLQGWILSRTEGRLCALYALG